VSADLRDVVAAADVPRTDGPVRRAASRWRGWLPYAMALLVYLAAVMISPGYLDPRQLSTLLILASMLGIVAIGQTLVILLGGIDLSVSATITLVNLVVAAIVAGADANVGRAVVVALAIGLAVGVTNGVGIHLFKIPDLIMTLASFTILTGVALLYSGGAPKGDSSPLLDRLATGRLAGVLPISFVVWAVLAAATIWFLRRTTAGRRVYAVGQNRVASRYSGVRVGRTVVGMYAVSGVCAAAVGVLVTGYTGSSYFGSGDAYQLASIAAVVVGGASIFGGRGGYGGTIAGTLIIVFLESLLRIIDVAESGRRIIYGVLILLLLVSYGRARSLRE
jgi:ribose transport system permease protein